MIPIRMIDITAITEATGWAPKVAISEGLRQTTDWYIQFFKTRNPEGEPIDNL